MGDEDRRGGWKANERKTSKTTLRVGRVRKDEAKIARQEIMEKKGEKSAVKTYIYIQ